MTHPFGVAAGQVIVHRHHMHAGAVEGVEIDRQGRHQRLAFAGLHFRDHAPVQHDAAHELHVEMALSQGALRRLADCREGIGQQVIQSLARRQPALQPAGPRLQFVVGERHQGRLQLVDLIDRFIETLMKRSLADPNSRLATVANIQTSLIKDLRRDFRRIQRPAGALSWRGDRLTDRRGTIGCQRPDRRSQVFQLYSDFPVSPAKSAVRTGRLPRVTSALVPDSRLCMMAALFPASAAGATGARPPASETP